MTPPVQPKMLSSLQLQKVGLRDEIVTVIEVYIVFIM